MTQPENIPPVPPLPAPPQYGQPTPATAPSPEIPAPPTAPYAPAGYATPGYSAPGYPAPGYGAPAYGAPSPLGQALAPEPPRSPLLGRISLFVAIIAAIGPAIAIAIALVNVARYLTGTTLDTLLRFARGELSDIDLSILSPVRDWILLGEISFWAGTALGLWALVQGIIATVTRRGRAMGIAAIVVAVAAPIVYATAASVAFSSGAIAGIPV